MLTPAEKSEAERFDAYLRGDLAEEDAQLLERQLASDSALADRFEAHSRPTEHIRAVQPGDTPDLRNKVKRRIRRRSGGKFFGGSDLRSLLGSISLIALLIGLILFLLMGPFGLLGDDRVPSESAAQSVTDDQTENRLGQTHDEQTREYSEPPVAPLEVEQQNMDDNERALQAVRGGAGLATPGRVSGQGVRQDSRMIVLAYKVTTDKSREDMARELRLRLPDDDVIETDEGFEFSMSKSNVAPMLARLSEFGVEIEDFRREVPHTERNVAFFRVVLQ